MSNSIAVEKLRIGMFIQLEGGWLSHPFPLSSFRLASADQISVLRSLGLKSVRWLPERSDHDDDGQQLDATRSDAAAQDPPPPVSITPEQTRQAALASQRESARQCEAQHAETSAVLRQAMALSRSQPQPAGRATEALARALLDKMLCTAELGIRLMAGGGDRETAHAMNVAVISLLIGRTLGLGEQDMLDLSVGAMLHDVGKHDLPERTRHFDDSFVSSEVHSYRDHVNKGVAQGERMSLSAGALAVLAQHHENADGSGFPSHLKAERMALAVRVVAIVNRYDNLCNPQNRTPALTPHEAVAVLFAQGRQRYDSTVLNGFIRMMGVYPAGSLVQLTDDRYAMVIGANCSRPLKPRVLVHDVKVAREQALLLDLEQHPALGIRRSVTANRLSPAALHYLDPRPRVSYYFESLESVARCQ